LIIKILNKEEMSAARQIRLKDIEKQIPGTAQFAYNTIETIGT
jgi:hypothetical protein